MYKLVSATALAAVFALTPLCGASAESKTQANAPSDMKLTSQQCATLWNKAQGGASGDLSLDKAKPFLKESDKADVNKDKKVSSEEWSSACQKGWVMSETTVPAAEGTVSPSATKPEGATSDRTPSGAKNREPGSTAAGAPGVEGGKTPEGTSDRTPAHN